MITEERVMNKKYIFGFLIGILILLFAMPLGELYGAYIMPDTILVAEEYNMLKERAIISIQIIGTIITTLSGIGITFKLK